MALVANLYTIGNCFVSLAFSQRKHLQRAVAKLDVVKSEGYLQVSFVYHVPKKTELDNSLNLFYIYP
jgi:hypothetical protein